MKDFKNLLIFERKPTATGFKKRLDSVGGELLPLNMLNLVSQNIIWILLFILPVLLTYILAKRGVQTPSPVRWLLRLIPLVTHTIL